MRSGNSNITTLFMHLILTVVLLLGAAHEAKAGTYYVRNTNDSGPDSLRQAILNANSTPEDDRIVFHNTYGTITLTTGQLEIENNGTLEIYTSTTVTISGNNASRVFHIASGADVTLRRLTIRDGNGDQGGGIYNRGRLTLTSSIVSGNSAASRGGGIYNGPNSELTLNDSIVSDNSATDAGGGIYNVGSSVGGLLTLDNSTVRNNSSDRGGGIFNEYQGSTKLDNSTVTGNSAASNGGGINNCDFLYVYNSTISDNSAMNGGGIYNCDWDGRSHLYNSTVSNNSATSNGGGIYNESSLIMNNSTLSDNSAAAGGGIYNFNDDPQANIHLRLRNSIIANSSGGDCHNAGGANVSTSARHTLIEEGLACVNGTNTNNLTGDPMLGPLADNGGPTETHAILPGSPAIDAGDNAFAVDRSGNPLTADQRGSYRLIGAVDMGAYEIFAVNSTNDPGDGTCDTTECTLREAIDLANSTSENEVISFDLPPSSVITLTQSSLWIGDNGTLEIYPYHNLTISGNNASRVFHIASEADVTFRKLTIRDGNSDQGGGIYIGGKLTLNDSTVSGNSATSRGGGIYKGPNSELTLNDSTVSDNSAVDAGGGIYNDGGNWSRPLTLDNSIVSNNSSDRGGGIFNEYQTTTKLINSTVTGNSAASNGGGINNNDSLIVYNSTISDNSAMNGGGIHAGDSGPSSDSYLYNSTVSNNSATSNGGGMYVQDSLQMNNSTFSDNSAAVGGGIYNFNDYPQVTIHLSLSNSVIANSSGGDCHIAGGTDVNFHARHSLIEEGLACVNGTNTNNLTGDPMLGPLADNGGPTKTHALLPGSPAIDAGDNFYAFVNLFDRIPLTTDQRGAGFPRIYNSTVDIGAYEAGNRPPTAVCRDVEVTLAPGATTASADIDDGSSDPDGDALFRHYDPDGPYPAGDTTVTLTVSDVNGGESSCTGTVTVLYDFTGFFAPIDNENVNEVRAGGAVPVKFSLSGDKGLGILAPGYPVSRTLNCASMIGIGIPLETETAGSSSLTYDASSDSYKYVWKSDKSWKNTCRQLIVRLDDGSERSVNFSFK